MQIVVGKDQRKVDEARARHSFSVPTDSVWSIARVRELVLSAMSGSRITVFRRMKADTR